MSYLKIFTDGGSRGNPGEAGTGFVIHNGDTGETLWEQGDYLGKATNNVAEYTALINALEVAAKLGGTKLEVYADSELMIKQLNGQYKVKSEGLIPLYNKVRGMAAGFPNCKYTHVLRGKNKQADALANLAMDRKTQVGSRGAGETSPADAKASSVKAKTSLADQVTTASSPGKTSPEDKIAEIAYAYKTPFAPIGKVLSLGPGIYRENVSVGAQMMQVKAYLPKGSTLKPHRHLHEQISFVLVGKILFQTSEGDILLKQGQALQFAGNQEHGAQVLEDTIVLDTFVPIREDFLDTLGQ